MKKIIKSIGCIALCFGIGACTSNFEDYNTNQYQIYHAEPSTLLKSMIETIVNVQQNDSQMQDQMVGALGGYFTLSNRWAGTNFDTFNPSDAWNASLWNTSFEKIYGNFFQIQEATNSSGHFYAMAKLVRAMNMLRVTDSYGPIPYSKVRKGDFYVAYDSQEEVYKSILEDCANAATILYDYHIDTSGNRPLGENDPIYGGDYSKWAKLANAIQLRVSIRVSKAFPTMAKEYGESAINHPAGIIEANEDNALMECGSQTNPYYLAAVNWGDLRVNASIVDYMQGYNDPRISRYFKKSTFKGQSDKYIGMRSGTAGFAKGDVEGYSQPGFEANSQILVFCAAETAFLRAEGSLLGWNMGGLDKDFYNKGVTLSMQQYGLSADEYLKDNKSIPGAHLEDPRGSHLDYKPKTTITIAWEDDASIDVKQERIITQKWIANYPLGLEAWAEYRRTGYPELFPCIDNLSNIVSDNVRGMRRLRFPFTEVQNNSQNYNGGVAHLNGADSEVTDLIWANKNK